MKRINKKGFTLIELLAVIIILGVLLLIAVPSVSKYIQQSRQKTYATNVAKMIEAVSTEVNAYTTGYTFNSGEFLVIPFECIELERGSSVKSPFGPYVSKQSYVVVRRNGNNFEYQVAAYDETGFGTALVDDSVIADTSTLAITSIANTAVTAIAENTEADGSTSYSLALAGDAYKDLSSNVLACEAFKTNYK